jgi:hypothetical protein
MGVEGEAGLQVRNFPTSWLRDWLAWRGPDWRVEAVDFSGRWKNGPLEFSLSALTGTELAAGRPVKLEIRATGGVDGVTLETLNVFEAQQEALTASGKVPIVITPGAPPWWAADAKTDIVFNAATRPDAVFWGCLAEATGLVLERPELKINLAGNWRTLRGNLSLRLPRAEASAERFKTKMPVGQAIEGLIELDRDQIVLRHLSALVDGQRIHAEGRLQRPSSGWGSLKGASWKKFAQDHIGRLLMPSAALAAASV